MKSYHSSTDFDLDVKKFLPTLFLAVWYPDVHSEPELLYLERLLSLLELPRLWQYILSVYTYAMYKNVGNSKQPD